MIFVENKRCKKETIEKRHPNAAIMDVTSTSTERDTQILSPFYPHYNIPIPFTEGITATCVEAVWQGLKVFQNNDVDLSTFLNDTMKNLKRTVRKYGKPLGHRKGVYGTVLLGYLDARIQIYLPTYKWVLDNVPDVHSIVEKIREQSNIQDIVFLDYNTNPDILDITKPLSHAELLKLYIYGHYPEATMLYSSLSTKQASSISAILQVEKKEIDKKYPLFPSLEDDLK